MKTFIILLLSCILCFKLSASETIEDPQFKKFLKFIDHVDMEARLSYLISMQEKLDMYNTRVAQYFSVQLAIELEVLQKNTARSIENGFENIRYLKEQIYNSSNANEIKSCLSLMKKLKNEEMTQQYRLSISIFSEKNTAIG